MVIRIFFGSYIRKIFLLYFYCFGAFFEDFRFFEPFSGIMFTCGKFRDASFCVDGMFQSNFLKLYQVSLLFLCIVK